jgi:hypothetical protein
LIAEHERNAEDEPDDATHRRESEKGNHGTVAFAVGHALEAEHEVGQEAGEEKSEHRTGNAGEEGEQIGEEGPAGEVDIGSFCPALQEAAHRV